MTFDADRASFEVYRKKRPGKVPVTGKLAEITAEDEHAI